MMVRHEAIDDYVDEFGFVVGMDAMEMSLPTDPPPSVQALAVGDKISFRFAVDWEKPAIVVDQIQKLPQGRSCISGRRAETHPPTLADEASPAPRSRNRRSRAGQRRST
jgi:hypothetical protein